MMRVAMNLVPIVFLAVWPFAGVARGALQAEPDPPASEAVLHAGQLVCLDASGSFRVWSLPGGELDTAAAARFDRAGLRHITARGELLFAADSSMLWRWSDETRAWISVAEFEAGAEPLQALAVVGATPLLVFETSVQSPLAGRLYPAPETVKPKLGRGLRILAITGTDTMLWIGTGHGEWGGHLLGLDPKQGTWVQYGDTLSYVTGIVPPPPNTPNTANTPATPNTPAVTVTWAMQHFRSHSVVRQHGPDAAPTWEGPSLDERYCQALAWSPFDEVLYAVERDHVVTLTDGAPRPVATLDEWPADDERHAVGVAPGVAALLPFARKSVAIVPRHGAPWLLRQGSIARLAEP